MTDKEIDVVKQQIRQITRIADAAQFFVERYKRIDQNQLFYDAKWETEQQEMERLNAELKPQPEQPSAAELIFQKLLSIIDPLMPLIQAKLESLASDKEAEHQSLFAAADSPPEHR